MGVSPTQSVKTPHLLHNRYQTPPLAQLTKANPTPHPKDQWAIFLRVLGY